MATDTTNNISFLTAEANKPRRASDCGSTLVRPLLNLQYAAGGHSNPSIRRSLEQSDIQSTHRTSSCAGAPLQQQQHQLQQQHLTLAFDRQHFGSMSDLPYTNQMYGQQQHIMYGEQCQQLSTPQIGFARQHRSLSQEPPQQYDGQLRRTSGMCEQQQQQQQQQPQTQHQQQQFADVAMQMANMSTHMYSNCRSTDDVGEALVVTPPERIHSSANNADYRALCKQLSTTEKLALKLSWKRLCVKTSSGATRLFENTFEQMLRREKALKNVFFTRSFLGSMKGKRCELSTVNGHARYLSNYLERILKYIDGDKHVLLEDFADLGECHVPLANYGFTGRVWDTFGELLSQQLSCHDCCKAHPQCARAWNQVVAFLIDNLRAHFETQRRSANQNNQPATTSAATTNQVDACPYEPQQTMVYNVVPQFQQPFQQMQTDQYQMHQRYNQPNGV